MRSITVSCGLHAASKSEMMPVFLVSLLAILAICVAGIAAWHRRRDVLSGRYFTRETYDGLPPGDGDNPAGEKSRNAS
jgi:hypothetical protein